MKPKLSQQYLRECFYYFPDQEILVWRARPALHFVSTLARDSEGIANNWNSRHAGKEAGQVHKPTGYRTVGVNDWTYKVHLLAWVHYYGYWPAADVDHWDLVRTNNSIFNLREASRSTNIANRRKQANNSSGYKGVSWSQAASKWLAQIQIRGEYVYLGIFDCKEEAKRAYEKAAVDGFGSFARFS